MQISWTVACTACDEVSGQTYLQRYIQFVFAADTFVCLTAFAVFLIILSSLIALIGVSEKNELPHRYISGGDLAVFISNLAHAELWSEAAGFPDASLCLPINPACYVEHLSKHIVYALAQRVTTSIDHIC